MSHIQVNTEFFNLTLRIEKIIYLAASLVDEDLIEDLEAVLSGEDVADLVAWFGLPSSLLRGDPSADDIAQSLIDLRKFGFLIQAATPIRKHFAEHSWGSSWGGYYTTWLYADTLDEALEQAKVWAAAQHKRDQAKFKAAGGAA
ncbi:MAG: hypothetical protein HY849_00385 [Nitrosomonadales bacterium]|nr:hypothetical protein [Nitrosomonadales bacterium]